MTVTRRQAVRCRLPEAICLRFRRSKTMAVDRPIVVAGAGSIGCFVGGLCASAGRRVSLLARPRVIAEIERFGLILTSLEGSSWHVVPQRLKLSEDPRLLAEAGVILV